MIRPRPGAAFFIVACMLLAVAATAGPLEDGAAAYEAGDYARARTLWEPLARQGDADAQFNLALLYMNGKGVEKNDRKALLLFLEAARQGHAEAQYNAGLLFYTGRGIARSTRDALLWWRRAADQGLAAAKYNLGIMYAYGEGVGVDNERAIALWREAAGDGYAEAMNALAVAYEKGWFGLPKDPARAKAWREKYRRARPGR